MYVKTIIKNNRGKKRKGGYRRRYQAGGQLLTGPGANIAAGLTGGGGRAMLEDASMQLLGKGQDLLGGLKSGKVGVGAATDLLARGAEGLISKGSATANDAFRTDASQRTGAAVGGAIKGAGKGFDIGNKIIPGLGGAIGAGVGAIGGLFKGKKAMEDERKSAVRGLRERQNAQMRATAGQPDPFSAKAGAGFNTATSSTKAYDQASRAMMGGVRKYGKGGTKLPGGQMLPLPGGAVEFVGKKHNQGGIMLDERTEVEGGETMDKVKMKKEGGTMKDYIFSDHLKLGGTTFAKRHKDLVKRGGSQKEIQQLAKLQEKKANRTPKVMEHGGEYHDDQGRPTTEEGTLIATSQEEADRLRDEVNAGRTQADVDAANAESERIRAENEAKQQERAGRGSVQEKDEETGQRIYGGNEEANIGSWLQMMETDMGKLPPELQTFDFSKYKNEEGAFDPSKFNTKEDKDAFRSWYNSLPDDLVSGKLASDNDAGDLVFGQQWNSRRLLERPPNPEPIQFKEIEVQIPEIDIKVPEGGRKQRDVPVGAVLAGASQLIPPAYALLTKPANVPGYAPQAYAKPQLPRVNYNAERASNASDMRATMASIENNAAGPAGMVNMIAAMGKKRQGDLKIAQAESQANKMLSAEESKLGAQTSQFNIGQDATAQQFNRQLAREQIKDRREEVLGSLDAAADRIAGITGDVLDYKGQQRLAEATSGETGALLREELSRQYPDLSNAEIAAMAARMSAGQTQEAAPKEKKKKEKKVNAAREARKAGRKSIRAARRGEEVVQEARRGGYIKSRRKIRRR
tara:strand:- start:2142 stop:4544 length:2403 start_codon:yes stop_codon:yes gene_type:complete